MVRISTIPTTMLMNVFFAAALKIVLHQRFNEDTVILAELKPLKKPPTSMRPESAMDYVRRAVWGLLYADDACIVLRVPWGLAKMREVIVELCRAFTLSVSQKKTRPFACLHPVHRGRLMPVKEAGTPTNSCNPSPFRGATLPKSQTCPLKSPGGPVNAGCVPGVSYVSSTISRKWRSPSTP